MFVVDASVTLMWCFDDETTEPSQAVAPSIVHGRRRRTRATGRSRSPTACWTRRAPRPTRGGEARVRHAIVLRNLPVDIACRSDLEGALATVEVARAHDLTAYDAAYLELARSRGLGLATVDRAARRRMPYRRGPADRVGRIEQGNRSEEAVKRETQVVVIGGGVVGASVLYHLTKAGWTDVMLLERRELTAGSTWHAAGGMHTLNGDPNVARLQQYTIQLYEEIERVSGQDCSIHLPGGLMLADTEVRMDFLRMAVARGRYLGMDLELISAKEAQDLFPLMDPQYFVGALYDPVEGHVDPTGVTRAYVKCAQLLGAEVHQHTPVVGLSQRADGTWDVRVENGDVDPHRARRQRRRAVGARGRPDGRPGAAGPGHGAHLPADPGHARGRRARREDRQRDADGARLRRRDLHPPGRRLDAARAPTSRRACRGRRARRRGTSGRSC